MSRTLIRPAVAEKTHYDSTGGHPAPERTEQGHSRPNSYFSSLCSGSTKLCALSWISFCVIAPLSLRLPNAVRCVCERSAESTKEQPRPHSHVILPANVDSRRDNRPTAKRQDRLGMQFKVQRSLTSSLPSSAWFGGPRLRLSYYCCV